MNRLTKKNRKELYGWKFDLIDLAASGGNPPFTPQGLMEYDRV